MQRNELLLVLALGALILAGLIYEAHRGAGKTAEVIVSHPGNTPFDATAPLSVSPSSSSAPSANQNAILTNEERMLLQTLNTASQNQLMNLPGIGETISAQIIASRQRLGGFTSIEQVLEVNGIGTAKLETLQAYFQTQINAVPQKTPASPQLPVIIPPARSNPPVPSRSNQKISLNHASREQLMTVSGIGSALADSILQARQQRGGFKNWNDVDSVSGIGEQRLQELKKHFILP